MSGVTYVVQHMFIVSTILSLCLVIGGRAVWVVLMIWCITLYAVQGKLFSWFNFTR